MRFWNIVRSKIAMEKDRNCPFTNIVNLLRAREITGKMRRSDVPRLPQMLRNMSLLHSNYYSEEIFVRQLLYDRTGERYVTCRDDGFVELFSARDGSLIGKLKDIIGPVSNICLSDDNDLIAAVSDNSVAVWRLQTMDLLVSFTFTFMSHDWITSVFFLTKAQQCYLAVVTIDAIVTFVPYDDDGDHDIKLPCLDGMKQPVEFEEEAGFSSKIGAQASLSPCGRYLLVGCFYMRVFTVDIRSGCPVCLMDVKIQLKLTTSLRFLSQYMTHADWSRSGERFIATASDEEIILCSLTENRKRFAISRHLGWGDVVAMCWDARDVYVVTTHVGKKLMRLWDPNTGKLVNEVMTEFEIVYLMAHPIDQGIIVSFYRNETFVIWDMLASTPLVIFQTSIMSQPTCSIWSPHGDELLLAESKGYVSAFSCNADFCYRSRIFEDEMENSDGQNSGE